MSLFWVVGKLSGLDETCSGQAELLARTQCILSCLWVFHIIGDDNGIRKPRSHRGTRDIL